MPKVEPSQAAPAPAPAAPVPPHVAPAPAVPVPAVQPMAVNGTKWLGMGHGMGPQDHGIQ